MCLARAAALAMLVLAESAGALAQAEAPSSREAPVARAELARDEGDHERALELALAAAAIRRTPSLELFIAQQRALTGRRDEALASATECARMAAADPALRNREVILATCRELASALSGGLALVTVRVPSARPDLRVTRAAICLRTHGAVRSRSRPAPCTCRRPRAAHRFGSR